jgi:septal ring factor EnvC (AmiA/AmiB activator)
MKKMVFIAVASMFFYSGFSQNLDEKIKQLEELNERISQTEELINQAAAEKEKKQSELKQTEKRKQDSESTVKKLISNEKTRKIELDKTISDLKMTAVQLDNLILLFQKEMENLTHAHYESEVYPSKKQDCRYLAHLADQTAQQISTYYHQKSNLEKKKNTEDKQYENLILTRIKADQDRKNYSQQVSSLKKNIQNLDKQREEALQRKKELEENAAALDELIKKLQIELADIEYSYEFSTPKLIWPARGPIIRKFGDQYNSEYKVSTRNNGIDIALPEGSDVIAVEKGVVAFAERYNAAGKMIIIDHQNGFFTLYSHNSLLLVAKGDNVEKNQKIAASGQTGSTEVPLLHFEIRRRGVPIDPMIYLE